MSVADVIATSGSAAGNRRFVAADDSGLSDADAAVIGPELLRLCRNEPERLTPAAVVAAAADFRSPIRRFFQWDNLAAADAFRQAQAARLMRSVRVQVIDHRGKPYPPLPLFIHFAPRPAAAPQPPAEEAEGNGSADVAKLPQRGNGSGGPVPAKLPEPESVPHASARPRAVQLEVVSGRPAAAPAAASLATARRALLADLKDFLAHVERQARALEPADRALLEFEFGAVREAARKCIVDAAGARK